MRSAVDRDDAALIELLVAHGAERDEDALYHACEHGGTALLEALWKPGAERYVSHKVDFEDLEGLRWFLDRGADVNERCCLHHAIAGSLRFIEVILDAGADIDRPWTFWDVGRRPLALAARCGHLAAYELLESLGATAELDDVDPPSSRWLAASRSRSRAPGRRRSATRRPTTTAGSSASSRSSTARRSSARSSTPGGRRHARLEQLRRSTRPRCTVAARRRAAGRAGAQPGRGRGRPRADPLDCAIWGIRYNRAHDGDYVGTVEALAAWARRRSTSRRAPTRPSTAVLERHGECGDRPRNAQVAASAAAAGKRFRGRLQAARSDAACPAASGRRHGEAAGASRAGTSVGSTRSFRICPAADQPGTAVRETSSTRCTGPTSSTAPSGQVLSNISLSFLHGAKIGVLGPNGAGKSTLLRIMAGLEEPSSGVAELDPKATVGFLAQEPELDAAKDVRANVEDGVRELRDLLDRFNAISAASPSPTPTSTRCSRSRRRCRSRSTGRTRGASTRRSTARWTRSASRTATAT